MSEPIWQNLNVTTKFGKTFQTEKPEGIIQNTKHIHI